MTWCAPTERRERPETFITFSFNASKTWTNKYIVWQPTSFQVEDSTGPWKQLEQLDLSESLYVTLPQLIQADQREKKQESIQILLEK